MNTDPNRNRATRELAEGKRPIVASRSPLVASGPKVAPRAVSSPTVGGEVHNGRHQRR